MTGPSDNLSHPGELRPLPHGKHGRRPLEERSNWSPWLPATEAYPEVPSLLRNISLALLSLFLLAVVVMILLML
jgi:hypothetical protein